MICSEYGPPVTNPLISQSDSHNTQLSWEGRRWIFILENVKTKVWCHTHSIVMKIRITNNLVSLKWHQYPTTSYFFLMFFIFEEEVVCWNAEVEVLLQYSEWTAFCCTSIYFFNFLHVAQLSIALGQHTLPHVMSVKGIERWRGEVYIWCHIRYNGD